MQATRKSAKVAAAGWVAQLVQLLIEEAHAAGLDDALLDPLGTESGRSHVRAMIDSLKRSSGMDLDADLDVLVKYDETLEQKIERLRNLGLTSANQDLTSANFPVPEGRNGTVKMRLALAKPGRAMVTETALEYVQGCNLEVGDPYQLLDLLEQHWERLPSLMAEGLRIVALVAYRQNPSGNRYVVYFGGRGPIRRLNFIGAFDLWRGFRFLGSRSVPSNA